MKAARLLVLAIAVVAGGLAALLASGSDNTPPAAPAPVVQIDTVEVLVAKNDLGIGQKVGADDLRWQIWPSAAATGAAYIRRSERAGAVEQLAGAIVRSPLLAGEPVRDGKLIKGQGSGYMAAILPSGMRAVSTEISPETGAGGFILPNDHVDVLLTRRDRETERATGLDAHVSESILTDIRVLAIDQTVEEKNGQRVVVGRTATLELTPRQTETLAMARQMGTLSLALRSLLDSGPSKTPEGDDKDAKSRSRMNVVRFGVSTSVMPK
jgi:pilus assembly protein CpaB